jgi:hypothetical protein
MAEVAPALSLRYRGRAGSGWNQTSMNLGSPGISRLRSTCPRGERSSCKYSLASWSKGIWVMGGRSRLLLEMMCADDRVRSE